MNTVSVRWVSRMLTPNCTQVSMNFSKHTDVTSKNLYHNSLFSMKRGTGVGCFSFFFWLRVLDKAQYSAFESTLNSPIVSYRIVTCIQNFDSKSEQQSMQWNERIGQNCHSIILYNSAFFHVKCKQPTTAKMHKIFIAQKSYCTRRVLSLATIRSKYYFNYILNRTR